MDTSILNESAITSASLASHLPRPISGHSANESSISARLPPRTLDESSSDVIPTILPQPSQFTRSSTSQFHPASYHSKENRASEASLYAKLRKDHENTSAQRDTESKLRFDLEQSKLSLIESYQLREERMATEMKAMKIHYEQLIKEKEHGFQVQLTEKEQEIQKLEIRLKDTSNVCKERVNEKEQYLLKQIEEQEKVWKQRLAAQKEEHQKAIRTIEDRHSLEQEGRQLSERAKLEAKEESAKQAYERRIKKFEAQVQEVQQHYHEKELIIHGSLEEARREILNLKSAADAKEESLRDELLLKDKRLIAVQAKLYTVDEIMRVADTWRSISREVASNVIKACVAVQDLPPAPVPDPALMSDVFQGYAREAELNALRQQYQAKLKYYLALCQNHVAVNKELLARALRHSKRVIERVKAEIVPGFDYDLNE